MENLKAAGGGMRDGLRWVAVLEALCALGLVLFWPVFLFSGNIADRGPELFLAFEKAFILPDVVFLLPCLVLGALGLWRGRDYGRYFTQLAASAVLFLALLDLSFNFQQGFYNFGSPGGLLYFAMHMALLAGSLAVLAALWSAERRKRENG